MADMPGFVGFLDVLGDAAGLAWPPSPTVMAFLGLLLLVLLIAVWIQRML